MITNWVIETLKLLLDTDTIESIQILYFKINIDSLLLLINTILILLILIKILFMINKRLNKLK